MYVKDIELFCCILAGDGFLHDQYMTLYVSV